MELNKKLTPTQERRFKSIYKQREQGKPFAYITGNKDFLNYTFRVNKHTLIPRPETEELVLSAKEFLKNTSKRKILDMGTGSGCIAISLALITHNQHIITASDISPAALKVAKQNARKLNAKVRFIKSNLFSKSTRVFDVVIANLPYVLPTDYKLLFSNLKYEPGQAITDNTTSWELTQRFFKVLPGHIHSQSVILLEHDPKAKPLIQRLSKQFLPTHKLIIKKDLQKLYRYYYLVPNP